jgi:hypothetical protein
MITKLRCTALSLPVFVLLSSRPAAAIDCCFVDDPNQQTCYVSPIQSNEELSGGVCGHTITGSNCLMQIKDDVTVTVSAPFGDCLTIGPGVTVDMEDHTFTCTSTVFPWGCNSAFVVAGSGGTSQKVAVKNGVFAGCWYAGAVRRGAGSGTNHSVENVTVDGTNLGQCGSRGNGINGIFTVTGVLVTNTLDYGVKLDLSGAKVEHSILRNNVADAIESTGVSGQTINNVFLIDNAYGVNKTADTASTIATKGSVIRDSIGCNCLRVGVCDDTCSQSQMLNFVGDKTFVDDEIK